MTPLTAHELQAELARRRAKFPGNRLLIPALVEEVGELVDALLDGDRNAVRLEAIQVAAVAIRIAEEGDATDYSRSNFAQLIRFVGRNACISDLALGLLEDDSDPSFDNMTAEEMQP